MIILSGRRSLPPWIINHGSTSGGAAGKRTSKTKKKNNIKNCFCNSMYDVCMAFRYCDNTQNFDRPEEKVLELNRNKYGQSQEKSWPQGEDSRGR
jgi:hypothetical protein